MAGAEDFTTHRFQVDPEAKDYCLCGWHKSADCHGNESPKDCSECTRLQRENAELRKDRQDQARALDELVNVIERLRAKLDAAEADTRRLAKFVVNYTNQHFGGDWACVECHANSNILVDGFRCAYHRAKAIDAAMDAQKGGE